MDSTKMPEGVDSIQVALSGAVRQILRAVAADAPSPVSVSGAADLVKAYPMRGLVGRFRWNEIVRDATRHIWLYGMAEHGYAEDDEVPGILQKAAKAACEIRVLLVSPEYQGLGEIDEDEENPRGTLAARTRASLRRFARMRDLCAGRLSIRVYSSAPMVSIVRGDGRILMTPYVRFLLGNNSPTFELDRVSNDGLFDRYCRHFEKVWDRHLVTAETADTPAVLYVDLHLIHEVTSPLAFAVLRERGLPVRRTDLTLATMDHSTPTRTEQVFGGAPITIDSAARQVRELETNCAAFGVELLGLRSAQRGIVHIIGPESGITQPGKTIVCGDSHTSTHGAVGALAFGIGTTEVGHVLATQCLLQRKARTFSINVSGRLHAGVTAKDLILAIIGKIGVGGGTGHVIEYRGETIRALDMDERMTVCNMSIEAGARAGMIAPDETTYAYLSGRQRAPKGADWERALEQWRQLPTDTGARFDKEIDVDAATLEPMITYGTNPGMVIPISGAIPVKKGDVVFEKSLAYMGLEAGAAIKDQIVNVVFLGSCTNARLSDLRSAANLLRGHKVAKGVQMLVVPGSQQVKKDAEAEGLHTIFIEAGAEWRESGCSMCLGMNGDLVAKGQYSVSTSNRNFEGRQGVGARTLLASPLTAAACAVRGRVTDPRELMNG